jgi:hypothetical protein
MAEWFKATVLKTVERKLRGFESYSLRHATSVARKTDGAPGAFWPSHAGLSVRGCRLPGRERMGARIPGP